MKKTLILMAAAIALTACGLTKQAPQNTTAAAPAEEVESLGPKMQKSDEQKYAEDLNRENPRAWGRYNGFKNQNLEAFAATVARAELASEISTLVQTALEIYSGNAEIDSVNPGETEEAAKVNELGGKQKIKAVSEQIIRGSRVVMTDRYRQKDGTYDCYAAVEVSLQSVLNNIRNNKTIQEAISQARREQIDYNSQKFEESMQSAFERLRDGQQQF